VFDFQEVELLFHGLPNIDMDDWMRNTEYTGEFNGQANHKVITLSPPPLPSSLILIGALHAVHSVIVVI
jgi:hypothetical protein